MKHAVMFTRKSVNAKTGPIPVTTTSRATCPDACPLKNNGCYAEHGNIGGIFRALTKTKAGRSFANGAARIKTMGWDELCAQVTALPDDTFWRHNQAGDLPGDGDRIDLVALAKLVRANKGKRGFTYTHKPLDRSNASAIRYANQNGFTVNLSADDLSEADQLSELGIAPVVVVLPAEISGNAAVHTPAGRRVSVCPATYRDDVTCASCQLCQRQNRKSIVGFPAHGAAKRKASTVAERQWRLETETPF